MTAKTFLLSCVFAGAFAIPAFAENKGDSNFDVELGGYAKLYAVATEQDTAPGLGIQPVDILRASEIHFNAETRLESGLKVGVHVEGQSDPGDGFAADETFLYLSGEWGQLNFGGKDGAAYLLQVAAPSADRDIDGVRQQITPVNFTAMGVAVGETDYDQNISAKNDKITYLTPLYSGLQLAASYTPDLDASRGNNGNSLENDDTTPSSDIFDGAIRYQTNIEEISLISGAGYTHAERETGPGDSRDAWNAGLVLGYHDVSIGASYQHDNEGSSDDAVDYTAVGATYKMEDWTLGASYYHKADHVGTSIDTDRVTCGVTYSWMPGIQFRSSVSDYNIDVSGGDEFHATSFVVGTLVDF